MVEKHFPGTEAGKEEMSRWVDEQSVFFTEPVYAAMYVDGEFVAIVKEKE